MGVSSRFIQFQGCASARFPAIKMRMRNRLTLYLLVAAFLIPLGCNKSSSPANVDTAKKGKKPKIVFVTNMVDPFWNVAAAGTRAAAKEFDADCQVEMPAKGSIVEQKRLVETALVRGVDGIAISPIDAKNQVDLINQASQQCKVLTQDSDAPDSKRLCFVGMDNYKAGRAAGQLVKEALPDGGKIMIFVGRLEQLNAQQRRQGVIDELLERAPQSLAQIKFDPPGNEISGGKYTIISTRTDNGDYTRAKSNAEDAMSAYPDLACMVGLFAYNVPACVEAVKEAKKTSKVKLVSFDENDGTLQGIIDGNVYGTVSQQPYYYGYHSVRILAGLIRGDSSVLPPNNFLEVPIKIVKKNNVDAFWTELKKLRAG
jgi:ribose transport system substrate-binding protein